MTAAGLSCNSCGTELTAKAKFCSECGAAVSLAPKPAEYKQVTVLFADVVHSMDIAAAVGPERLREIMAELADGCATVVKRFGGTVDKFTGDGIMAVFGAPKALEDHAVRGCRAALEVQLQAKQIAAAVRARDGVNLRLRVGLNSGEVIAGEIGSGLFGYTAVGEQVGMAQRMESAAPPGGVLLSASTARLVEMAASLGDVELVPIKGADTPVPGRQLLGMAERPAPGRSDSKLTGRHSEMATVLSLLDHAVEGRGAVLTVVGSPGIGKSRLVREMAEIAAERDVAVFTAHCESHATDIAFHVAAQLLRAATGVRGADAVAARARVRSQLPEADPEDVLLFDDLLGVADPEQEPPRIDADARRRRLITMISATSLARRFPGVYVIEDAHWIDAVSESILAEFVTTIPQTPSLVLVTYRPEYHGALHQVAGAQTIALAPLNDSETSTLVSRLVGPDPSVGAAVTMIAEKSAGNPFFAEELVRDLAERGVLRGNRCAYVSTSDVGEIGVPATLQATIAARIDRLDAAAKRTLSAAAVVGTKFSRDILATLGIDPALQDLVSGEFIDEIRSGPLSEYVFHHPLVRAVAYASQLKSDRATLHRRVAAAIESDDIAAPDENAALIAEHLESAGDLGAAYSWHMRAATWSTNRDIGAARLSWERARKVADALPSDHPARAAMRITPRTMLCGIAFRVQLSVAGERIEELRELCTAVGDKRSLAIAMAGLVVDRAFHGRLREASQLAAEVMALTESLDDPTLTVGLSFAAIYAKFESGEWADVLRWSQQVIDLADGDPCRGNFIVGSPLARAFTTRAMARYCLGRPGWRDDLVRGVALARSAEPASYATVVTYVYFVAIPYGVLEPDDAAIREIEDALRIVERSGDDLALSNAQMALGFAAAQRPTAAERDRGQQLLAGLSETFPRRGRHLDDLPLVNAYLAREMARRGDPDCALPLVRAAADELFDHGHLLLWAIPVTGVLVEVLLERGADGDVAEAEAAIDRLVAAPADEGLVIRNIWLLRLRTLLARTRGDSEVQAQLSDRYRNMAKTLGFEGHMAWAQAMCEAP